MPATDSPAIATGARAGRQKSHRRSGRRRHRAARRRPDADARRPARRCRRHPDRSPITGQPSRHCIGWRWTMRPNAPRSWKCTNQDSPRARLDPSALVRTVDRGAAAAEHDAIFVGPGNRPRAQHGLPAVRDAARGREDVVVAVALVELRALDRGMADGAVEDRHRIAAEHAAPVVAQAPQRQHAVEPGAALRPRVHQVHRAVVVPERAGVDPAARGRDQRERLPRPARIHRGGHEDRRRRDRRSTPRNGRRDGGGSAPRRPSRAAAGRTAARAAAAPRGRRSSS